MPSTPSSDSEKQRLLHSLDGFMSRLFEEKNDPSTQKIFKFVQGRLYQFKLASFTEASIIVTEAYMRIQKKIRQEDLEISSLPGYFKSVCYNIIREKKQEYIRHSNLKQKAKRSYEATWEDNSYDDLINEEITSKIIDFFSRLSEVDQEIMILRILKSLSWQEISLILQQKYGSCEISFSAQSLRQRFSRILKKIREDGLSMNMMASMLDSCAEM